MSVRTSGSGQGDKRITRRCSAQYVALGALGQLTIFAEQSCKVFWPVALPTGVQRWVEPAYLYLRD